MKRGGPGVPECCFRCSANSRDAIDCWPSDEQRIGSKDKVAVSW